MYKLTATLLLSLFSTGFCLADITMPIRGVVDGDTIKTSVNLPCPLCNVSIRLLGVDTPESTYLAKCPAEKEKALAAKNFVKTLIGTNTTMVIRNFKWDKYGGRIDAYVSINGVDISQSLIDNGLARPYTGQGPKSDWCN